jgi:protein-disulfide isomerase
MNSFQYAIAKAAWEASYEANHEDEFAGFDDLSPKRQRAWLAAAIAALEKAAEYAAGRSQ